MFCMPAAICMYIIVAPDPIKGFATSYPTQEQQAEVCVQRATEAVRHSEFREAMLLLSEGCKLKVANRGVSFSLHNRLGWVHTRLKQYALAIVESSKAADLDPDMWKPHWVRHLGWRGLGVYSMALQVNFLCVLLLLFLHPHMPLSVPSVPRSPVCTAG